MVEHPLPLTAAVDLEVPAPTSAPDMLLPHAAHGGPPSPIAASNTNCVAPSAAAHGLAPAVRTGHRQVVVRLISAPRDAAVGLVSGEVRGADCTLRPGLLRVVAPLAPTLARRLRGPGYDGLLSQRRVRIPWEHVGRERLLRAWKGVLREHGLPAGEVRLVGIFGPTPLGAVDGVALDATGEAAVVAMRRTRVPGPIGHVALARHVPSGRLLTVLVPSEDT